MNKAQRIVIEKRIAFLDQRVNAAHALGNDLSYDRAESRALQCALAEIGRLRGFEREAKILLRGAELSANDIHAQVHPVYGGYEVVFPAPASPDRHFAGATIYDAWRAIAEYSETGK